MNKERICKDLNIPLDKFIFEDNTENYFICKVTEEWIKAIKKKNSAKNCNYTNLDSFESIDKEKQETLKNIKLEETECLKTVVIKVSQHTATAIHHLNSNYEDEFYTIWKKLLQCNKEKQKFQPLSKFNHNANMHSGLCLVDETVKSNCICTFPLLSIFSEEDDQKNIYAVYENMPYSVEDVLSYSPTVINISSAGIKPNFMLYQLLRHVVLMDELYKIRLNLTWGDIKIDERNWLHFIHFDEALKTINNTRRSVFFVTILFVLSPFGLFKFVATFAILTLVHDF